MRKFAVKKCREKVRCMHCRRKEIILTIQSNLGAIESVCLTKREVGRLINELSKKALIPLRVLPKESILPGD